MFFDIDSTYRNRTDNPNPADFVVMRPQNHLCSDTYFRDICSDNTVMFPSMETRPLTFYTETINSPTTTIGSTAEIQNLPYMYQTNSPSIVQLDELPLGPTDPNELQVLPSSLYPRNSIPLGQANNFYINRILENYDTGEFRTITSFYYDTSLENNIFQEGIVLFYTSSGLVFQIGVDNTRTSTILPPSNIDRFYQGKYLLITSGNANGQKRLIINYNAQSSTQNIFTLQLPLNPAPSAGDTFQIVSDRKWFATIDRPFSNAIPQYPVYRDPLPPYSFIYTTDIINTSNQQPNVISITSDPLSIVIGEINGSVDADGLPLNDLISFNDVFASSTLVSDTPSQGNVGNDTVYISYMSSSSLTPTRSALQNTPLGKAYSHTIQFSLVGFNDVSIYERNPSILNVTGAVVTVGGIYPVNSKNFIVIDNFVNEISWVKNLNINFTYTFIDGTINTQYIHYISSASDISYCAITPIGVYIRHGPFFAAQHVLTSPVPVYNRQWTFQLSTSNSTWSSIVRFISLGRFYAVGNNTVMSSADGINWQTIPSIPLSNWASLATSPTVLCAVGPNTIMTSTNGTNWTSQVPSDIASLSCLCWSDDLGIFVALGDNVVMTSSNGTTWTTTSIIIPSTTWNSVVWSSDLGLLCACANSQVITSPDGTIWTSQVISPETWSSVCWSAEVGIFVIVAQNGNIATSPDGVIWTLQAPQVGTWQSVTWAAEIGLFCAISSTGGNIILSPDGVSWYTETAPNTNLWKSVCWAPDLGMFCAVSISGVNNRVMTSIYGYIQNWTDTLSVPVGTWKSICWSPENDILCSVGTNQVMTSDNLIDWTSQTCPIVDWESVCWASGIGIFCSVGNAAVMTSLDGTVWISQTPASAVQWNSVCWSPDLALLCAVGNADCMTSSDGTIWNSQVIGLGNWREVCWSPDLSLFCAIGTNVCATSPDGSIWSIQVCPLYDWSSVCWSSELSLFCSVSSDGYIMTSADGSMWTLQVSPVLNSWSSICWSSELQVFCAVSSTGFGNRVIVSKDGIIWTIQKTNPNTFNGICWTPKFGSFSACAVDVITYHTHISQEMMTNSINISTHIGENGVHIDVNAIDVPLSFFFGSENNTESLIDLTGPLLEWRLGDPITNNITTAEYRITNLNISSHINTRGCIGSYLFVPPTINMDSSGLNRSIIIDPTLTSVLYDQVLFPDQGRQSVLYGSGTIYLNPSWFFDEDEFVLCLWVAGSNQNVNVLFMNGSNLGLNITITSSLITVVLDNSPFNKLEYNIVTSSTSYRHFVFNFLSIGNSLYIDNVLQVVNYVSGNASTYIPFSGITPILNRSEIILVDAYIDDVYIYNHPITNLDRLRMINIDSNRWNVKVYNSTSLDSYINFANVYTPFMANIQSERNSINTFSAALFTPDSVVSGEADSLSQIYIGIYSNVSPVNTTFLVSQPLYGQIVLQNIGVYRNKPYIFWIEYYRDTLYYILNISNSTFGTDLFQSKSFICPPISGLDSSVFYLENYILGTAVNVDRDVIHSCVLDYDGINFFYSLYTYSSGGVWTSVILPFVINTTLTFADIGGKYIGTRLISFEDNIVVFSWNPFSGFEYSFSVDAGVTFSSPILIDNDVINVEVTTVQGNVSRKILLVYNRDNNDGTYNTIILNEFDFTISLGTRYRIRRNKPKENGKYDQNPIVSATSNTITFSNTSTVDNVYNGMFVWIYNAAIGNVPSPYEGFNKAYLIKSYDGASRTATLYELLPDLEILALPPGTNNVNWEILGDVRDCFNGIDYHGSTQGADQCYKVSLTHIILPNKVLRTGFGNQISFYPYIYVRLSPADTQTQRFFYSNNPNAALATFKVPVSQFTNDPSSLPYIRLSSSTRVLSRYDLNNGFRFTVWLPNGELFETEEKDSRPPDFPNPLLQISAEFLFEPSNGA